MKKGDIQIIKLIHLSKGNTKQLNSVKALIKAHPYFTGQRVKLYKLIAKYKNK